MEDTNSRTIPNYFSKKKEVAEVVICEEFFYYMKEHESSNFIFTDGSKSDAGIGFGVVLKDFKKYGALPKCASVLRQNYTPF